MSSRIADFIRYSITGWNQILYLRDMKTSYLSGFISRTSVGDTELELSLDFTVSNSFLYTEGHSCPLGVSGCYSSSLSDDFLPVTLPHGVSADHHHFRLITDPKIPGDQKLRSRISKNRDVHGSLGFGPNSTWMRDRVVKVYEDDVGAPIVRETKTNGQIVDALYQPLAVNRYSFEHTDPESVGWEVEVGFSMTGGGSTDLVIPKASVVIDPGNADIVIPSKFFGNRIGRIQTTSCARKHVPHITLRLDSGETIEISSTQLIHPYRPRGGKCHLRVVMSPVAEKIIVGRSLTRSLHRLVLDGPSRRIGFVRSKRNEDRGGFRYPPLSIPVFNSPAVSFNGIDFVMRSLDSAAEGGAGLVLVFAEILNGGLQKCWYFEDVLALPMGRRDWSGGVATVVTRGLSSFGQVQFIPSIYSDRGKVRWEYRFNLQVADDDLSVFSQYIEWRKSDSSVEVCAIRDPKPFPRSHFQKRIVRELSSSSDTELGSSRSDTYSERST